MPVATLSAVGAVRTFNPHSKHPARAVQAWQILVGRAMRGQSLSYEDFSRLMYGKDAAGVLGGILDHVAYYCDLHRLPPLTAILVGKFPRTPGEEIPVSRQFADADREQVFGQDWYDIYPPGEAELRHAYDTGGKG